MSPRVASDVKIISGVEKVVSTEFVGLTVAEARSKFSDLLGIPKNATALVNGESVTDEDDWELESGDELVFSRVLGSKG